MKDNITSRSFLGWVIFGAIQLNLYLYCLEMLFKLGFGLLWNSNLLEPDLLHSIVWLNRHNSFYELFGEKLWFGIFGAIVGAGAWIFEKYIQKLKNNL